MPTIKSSGDLITSISTDMADNNAGLISAEDVRHNMEDTVASIKRIVCSGNTDGTGDGDGYPFYRNIRARQVTTSDSSAGIFIGESGIQFPNWGGTASALINNVQIEPFPGEGGIDHNNRLNLTAANPHTQYYKTVGTNPCTDDFVLGDFWINASGYTAKGFRFVPVGPGTDQEIYVSGTMRWADNSIMENAKGVANAWLQFDGSGTDASTNMPSIRGYHGISGIERLAPGKFKIVFNSGVFKDNNYVALGNANGTTASGSKEDMANNTVGFVLRDMVDNNPDLRSTTLLVKDNSGDYVDAELIDCAFYGYAINEASGLPVPTTSVSSSYTDP